jgi:multicomponent Na+:H+ antiporter subunit B
LKLAAIFLVVLCGGLLIFCTLEFPSWGDPFAPASLHVSPRYIEKALEETAAPNLVTAVLADYRSYDTMFETIVIFAAGVACLILVRRTRSIRRPRRLIRHIPSGITLRLKEGAPDPPPSPDFEKIDSEWVPYDIVTKTSCRLIVPFSQIFALYVIAHGHHSPGGGFQGGVIMGASIILYALSNNLRSALARVSENAAVFLCGLGVLIYAGTGFLCIAMGGNYLDYSALAALFGLNAAGARSLGILFVEIGVGISVMAVMITLYYNLVSAGHHDEGL